MWLVWLVIAGVLFVGEILTAGFLLLWFAIAAIVAMLVSFLTTNLFIQIFSFCNSISLTSYIYKTITIKIRKK